MRERHPHDKQGMSSDHLSEEGNESDEGRPRSAHFPSGEEAGELYEGGAEEHLYEAGERVLAWHLERIYEAKVLEAKRKPKQRPSGYLIHYTGWKDRWDEVVGAERLLKYTPANKLLQVRISQAYTQQKAARRRQSAGLGTGPAGGGGDEQSPSGEPSSKRQRRQGRSGASGMSPSLTHDDSWESLGGGEARAPWTTDMMPLSLKRRLVEDWRLIFEQHQLVTLPSPHPVSAVFTTFLQQLPLVNCPRKEEYVKVLDGLTAYFDKSLGTLLLYRFERFQYSDFLERSPDQPPSSAYGPEFLLRLFVKLPALLNLASIEDSSHALIYSVVDELLEWLSYHSAKYFSRKHYEPAAPQYIRAAARF